MMSDGSRAVCITGGTGFIGRHLIVALESAGGSSIRFLSRRGVHGADGASASPTAVCGDLLDEEVAHRFVTPGCVVVNLAFARGSPAEANRARASNLAAACRAAPAAHLIHCSTAVVAGRAEPDTVIETVPCRPVNPYQASKLEIEQLLLERLAGRCPVTVLRPTAVFGRGGDNLRSLIGSLIRRPWLVNLLPATLFADRRLHLVCVENVIAAFRFALSRGAELDGEIFLVSDDEAVANSYREVLNIAARELGMRPFPPWRVPFQQAIVALILRLAGRDDPNPRRIYSSRKLRERGFRAPLELAEGVRRFARQYAESPGRR